MCSSDLLDRMATRTELYELIDYPAWDGYEARYVRDADVDAADTGGGTS